MTDGSCTVDGCSRRVNARGLCSLHYDRWKAHGSTAEPPKAKARRLRAEARRAGNSTYFTGDPCPHGHVSPRRVVNSECLQCFKENDFRRRTEDPGGYRKKKREWRQQNIEHYRATEKAWKHRNIGKARAYCMKHYTAKMKAIPVWADKNAIWYMYEHCPSGYHVDHVIPLQGETVCGLHVEHNLQWLPASENCSKGNKYGG